MDHGEQLPVFLAPTQERHSNTNTDAAYSYGEAPVSFVPNAFGADNER